MKITLPASRRFTADVGQLSRKRHLLPFMMTLDVSKLFPYCKEQKLSFTGALVKTLGEAMAYFPRVHAIKGRRDTLHLVEEINIAVLVEKEVDGHLVPLPHLIRSPQEQTLSEITDSLRAAKETRGKSFQDPKEKLFAALPQWLRLLMWKRYLKNPTYVKNAMGTAVVSSVGMKGSGRGHMIPTTIHPMSLAVGAVYQEGERYWLPLTFVMDHDVVDGAEAMRFIAYFQGLLDSY